MGADSQQNQDSTTYQEAIQNPDSIMIYDGLKKIRKEFLNDIDKGFQNFKTITPDFSILEINAYHQSLILFGIVIPLILMTVIATLTNADFTSFLELTKLYQPLSIWLALVFAEILIFALMFIYGMRRNISKTRREILGEKLELYTIGFICGTSIAILSFFFFVFLFIFSITDYSSSSLLVICVTIIYIAQIVIPITMPKLPNILVGIEKRKIHRRIGNDLKRIKKYDIGKSTQDSLDLDWHLFRDLKNAKSHDEYIMYRNIIGIICETQGELDEALEVYKISLDNCESLAKEQQTHESFENVLKCLNYVIGVLEKQGKTDEAEPYRQRAQEINELLEKEESK